MTRAKEFVVAQRLEKTTIADMQSAGVRGVILRGDYNCSHLATVRADIWSDDVHLPDLEGRYVCGHRGADIRPVFCADFNSPGVCA
jgi:hypothetical protein